MLLVGDVDILEGEVLKAVFIAGAHIKEVAAVHADALYRDVVAVGWSHVGTVFRLVELRPRAYYEERRTVASEVFHCDILIVLRCVGTHLQPQQTRCLTNLYAT